MNPEEKAAMFQEALVEADRFLEHPLDPDDVICARDVIHDALRRALKEQEPTT